MPTARHACSRACPASDLFRPEAEPIHAGVDFQPDREAVRPRVLLQHRDLLERVNDELQIVRGRNFELSCEERAFEHDDRMSKLRGSQREPFLHASHAESIGAGKCARGMNEAVPVGVGFDRRDDARSRCEAADYRKVVAQSSRVDASHKETARDFPQKSEPPTSGVKGRNCVNCPRNVS